MSPATDDDDAADELRDAAASLRRLANGENLEQVYPEFTPHNVIGALCLDRGTVAHAWMAANPPDDGEAITAAWMDAVGDDPRGDRMWVWPLLGGGAAVRVWASRDPAGPAWRCQVEDTGDECERESVVLPQLATRGQLRRLLAALGVPAAKGGAPCPE